MNRPTEDAEVTRVVHCKRDRYDIYIGRPSKWGNPYVIGRDGTREQVIAKYRAWVLRRPELLAALPELRGKTLGCWCAPQPCHGDVLAELAGRRLSTLSDPPAPAPPPPAPAPEPLRKAPAPPDRPPPRP